MSQTGLPYESNWITSKLCGGLGNRLFQLAAAHTMSKIWSKPLVFAMPYCSPSEHGDYETIFKLFPLIPKIWKAEAEVSLEQGSVFQHVMLPQVAPADRVLLKGCWQAAGYISDSFTPSWDTVPEKAKLLDRWNLTTPTQRSKTAFLHIRLGDYKVLPHHQVNLLAYFTTCLEKFPEDTRFLVFSDTMEEARCLPIFNDRCVFVDEQDELKALYLMSQCSAGAITANSTFSWWGASFARQNLTDPGTYKAYMPGKWMAQCAETTDSIYPPWATVIPCI